MVSLPMINLWKRRSLLLYFSLLNIKLRYKNTYLGFLWTALEPLLYFTVLYIVFSTIREREEFFAIYLISGIMFFHLFVRGTSGGLTSLIGNDKILKSIKINREIFPVVSTLSIAILGFVDLAIFLILMPIFNFVPPVTVLLLPIPFLLLFGLILGLTYFLSIIAIYIRDVQPFWGIFSHSLLFISPVFWKLENVSGTILTQFHSINPLGQIIEIAHHLAIYGQIPPTNDLLYTTIFVLGILFSGYAIFNRLESKITERL